MKRRKGNLLSCQGIAIVITCMVMLSACGGGGGDAAPPTTIITTTTTTTTTTTVMPTAPSGSVVQGAVSGAIVFADHATGAEANYKMDPSEAATATTTAANGSFTLGAVPGYAYISVSSGGIDSITGMPAMPMLAPAGVGVVSPLTTMVTLNPNTQSAIASLGVNYADDISQSVTPAALLLVQSVQAVMTTLSTAMDPNNNKLTNDQSNAIQRDVLQRVADQIAGQSAAQLTDTTALRATLVTALTNGLNDVVADPANSNVAIPNTTTLANTVISDDFIDIVATAVGPGPGGVFSTTTKAAEATIITLADAVAINTETAKEGAAASTNVAVTPKPNTLPTISGSPAGSVAVGSSYSFTPTASDADGNSLTFTISNKPTWASFNSASGSLSGTPAAADVGTTTGIIISVTDGIAVVSLPAFNLSVPGGGGTNTPPTIAGTPEDSVFVGESYSFTPAAFDADGNTLMFTIVNRPTWASFSSQTGQLSGTPAEANIGTTSGIVIAVTDGISVVSLPAFNITVSPVTGSGGGTP